MLAPSDGVVSLMPNWRSGNWNNLQDFKEGDRAWPGANIAELPDASSLYVSARVDEVERGRMKLGQPASCASRPFLIASSRRTSRASARWQKPTSASWPPPRNFDLRVALDETDARLRPGMTATMRVAVERCRTSSCVPAEAVFTNAGEDVVYVLEREGSCGGRWSIERRNADHAVIRRGLRSRRARRARRPGDGGRRGAAMRLLRIVVVVLLVAGAGAAVVFGLPDLASPAGADPDDACHNAATSTSACTRSASWGRGAR